MNTIIALVTIDNLAFLLAQSRNDTPMMLKVIFWVLLFVWALFGVGWASSTDTNLIRGRNIVVVVLLAILGYYTFGF